MSSVPRTATEAGWLFGLLQASDTFYPTGAYAHSFGLEGLVEEIRAECLEAVHHSQKVEQVRGVCPLWGCEFA
jgi:hypothetical protein